jgi:HPt (histidine-containing phosphotransfer) domain-containing protein
MTMPLLSDAKAVPSEQSVDAAILHELHQLDDGGPPTIFRELVAVFSESTPRLLSQACAALGNPTQLTIIAHTLKGSCSNFGAHRMQALCLALEELGQQRKCDGAREIIDAIELEYFKVRKALICHEPKV